MPPPKKGLILVHTGDGKGKTTAAMGMALRGVGHGMKTLMVQFIKGTWKYGELEGIKKLAPNVELNVIGEGFVGIIDDDKSFDEHRQAAKKGVALALDKIKSGDYQLVVLDELNVACDLGLVSEEELESIVEARGEDQYLVITGRNAPDWLQDKADLVTEMKEVKHPYHKGILAQKGIDW